MPIKILKTETRNLGQLRYHYEIEKELASRLRNACREERRYLYSALYDELYRKVPLHPQLTQKMELGQRMNHVSGELKLLKRYLKRESIFLEIGPGDCSLSIEVAKLVRKTYAIDVSEEITEGRAFPKNFNLIISDGISIPVPENSIDVAYSNQLMEHLHPNDAVEQLQNIYKALNSGGIYVCITPNRLSGPHDISMYFDEVATGFHLKEYTFEELNVLFIRAGFSKVESYIGGRGIYLRFPQLLLRFNERKLEVLPIWLKRRIIRTLPYQTLLGIIIIGIK
jgi:SAM-dependent methyltransferase